MEIGAPSPALVLKYDVMFQRCPAITSCFIASDPASQIFKNCFTIFGISSVSTTFL